jgi:hypothetical protein
MLSLPNLATSQHYTQQQQNLPLADYDRSTFYGGAEKGYTDYPFVNEDAKNSAKI